MMREKQKIGRSEVWGERPSIHVLLPLLARRNQRSRLAFHGSIKDCWEQQAVIVSQARELIVPAPTHFLGMFPFVRGPTPQLPSESGSSSRLSSTCRIVPEGRGDRKVQGQPLRDHRVSPLTCCAGMRRLTFSGLARRAGESTAVCIVYVHESVRQHTLLSPFS